MHRLNRLVIVLVWIFLTTVGIANSATCGKDSEEKNKISFKDHTYYEFGLDKYQGSIPGSFFGDGTFCAFTAFFNEVQIKGKNTETGKMDVEISISEYKLDKEGYVISDKNDNYIINRRMKLIGRLEKKKIGNLIIWSGPIKDESTNEFEFYIKRSLKGPNLKAEESYAEFVNQHSDPCGDGGCEPLSIFVSAKTGHSGELRELLKNLPVENIRELTNADDCWDLSPEVDACFKADAYPLHENEVVKELLASKYVHVAQRVGAGAGVDTDSLAIDADDFIVKGELKAAKLAEIIQPQLEKSLAGENVSLSKPGIRNNWLFWTIKGPRSSLEGLSNPNPLSRSEWWKIRLQVAITGKNDGEFVLLVAMPETKKVRWMEANIPDDKKFQVEETNAPEFVDFQDRLKVEFTKYLSVWNESP